MEDSKIATGGPERGEAMVDGIPGAACGHTQGENSQRYEVGDPDFGLDEYSVYECGVKVCSGWSRMYARKIASALNESVVKQAN